MTYIARYVVLERDPGLKGVGWGVHVPIAMTVEVENPLRRAVISPDACSFPSNHTFFHAVQLPTATKLPRIPTST